MSDEHPRSHDPVGIFDSGIGGLTVAAAIRKLLPSENILYIGDTARVPYGAKSRGTVERYSVEIGGLLLAEGAKMLVVACNTASALALPRMQRVFGVPVQGVVVPGAEAAVRATKSGGIGVMATRATVASGAYEHAIRAMNPSARVASAACPLLVPLIEEGLFDDPVTDAMLRRYMAPLREAGADTIVLGCTHYPLLSAAIAKAAGPGVELVDSAWNCALAVRDLLDREGLSAPPDRLGRMEIALTDTPGAFLKSAQSVLGLDAAEISLRSVQSGA